MQDVAAAEGAAGSSAEAAEEEGAAGAEIGLGVDAAAEGEVGADAFFGGGAEGKDVSGFGLDGGVAGDGLAGELGGHVGAGEGEEGVGVEAEAGAGGGALDGRGVVGVADDAVGDAEAEVIHGAGRGDADVPEADASGIVLDRGLGAAFEDFDGVAVEGEGVEEGSGDGAGGELGRAARARR